MTSALEEQGFKLEPTSNGVRVLAPDGLETAAWHPSMFDPGNSRTYRNLLADLKRIGFDVVEATQSKAVERSRRQAERASGNGETVTDAVLEPQAEPEPTPPEPSELINLSAPHRELYDAIVADPGQKPMVLSQRLKWDRMATSRRGVELRNRGLIEVTGLRSATRYWPRGQVKTQDAPAPMPVRTRHVEPQDAVVRMTKLAERAGKQLAELDDVIRAIVTAYTDQEEELRTLRRKAKRLEALFAQGVDLL